MVKSKQQNKKHDVKLLHPQQKKEKINLDTGNCSSIKSFRKHVYNSTKTNKTEHKMKSYTF